jgi:hypothetical protein
VEGSLGGHPANQIDGLGVNVSLVLVGVVLLANSDASQGRTLLTEVCHNLTCVDARDGGNTLASTPLSERLDSSPMAVLQGIVLHNDTRSLDVGRLKVSEQAVLVTGGRGDAIVANQRLGEDEDLPTVGRIGHRFRVSDERGSENCLAGDIGFGAKRLAREDGAILSGVSSEA